MKCGFAHLGPLNLISPLLGIQGIIQLCMGVSEGYEDSLKARRHLGMALEVLYEHHQESDGGDDGPEGADWVHDRYFAGTSGADALGLGKKWVRIEYTPAITPATAG